MTPIRITWTPIRAKKEGVAPILLFSWILLWMKEGVAPILRDSSRFFGFLKEGVAPILENPILETA